MTTTTFVQTEILREPHRNETAGALTRVIKLLESGRANEALKELHALRAHLVTSPSSQLYDQRDEKVI